MAGRNNKTRLPLWLTQMTLQAVSVNSAVPLLHSHTCPCNKYFKRACNPISSRSRSSDMTLSCSQFYHTHNTHTHTHTHSPYLSPASGSQVLSPELQSQQNHKPKKSTILHNIYLSISRQLESMGYVHWQRCIPLRFTPCGYRSTNRKNVIKCVCGLSKVKVKQSLNMPGQALSVPGGWGSQISGEPAHKGGNVSPTHRPPVSGTNFC